MSINVSYYDVTQLDWIADAVDSGAILQSGVWQPIIQEFKQVKFTENQNRVQHRGNSQTLTIDQRTKKWVDIEFEYIAEKYDATSPAYGWWDIISQLFYGGATGSPTLRSTLGWIGAKINRATPEYWLCGGVKAESVVLKGSMTEGTMGISIKAMGRFHQFNTTNYVQGSATRRANVTKDPIVPSNDMTITVNGIDVSTLVQDFTLTMTRKYEKRGRSATVAASGTQVATSGQNFRELLESDFDASLELNLDPYGTTTAQLLTYLADTQMTDVSIAETASNGKVINFTASKINSADQSHAEQQSPSTVSLSIIGQTFNVTTV